MKLLLRSESSTFKSLSKDFILIIVGSAIMAAGLIMFILPNKMAIGGVPGLAIPLHFISELPIGLIILIINIPIFIMGVKQLGSFFGLRTIIAVFAFSGFTVLFEDVLFLPVLTREYFLAALYGGTLEGIGIGLIFRSGASVGGSTILASIISKKTNFKLGQIMMFFDFVVIAFGGFYFKNVEIVLWGILITYILTQVIDFVVAGPPTGKVAHIISTSMETLSAKIRDELHRGGTLLTGKGIFSGENREVLMVVIDNSEVIPLKSLVGSVDPNAFVIISNTYEIMGKGFEGKR